MPQPTSQQVDELSTLQRSYVVRVFDENAKAEIQSIAVTVTGKLHNSHSQLEAPQPLGEATQSVQTVPAANYEVSILPDRDAQLRALREEAKRLQTLGWSTAINENTMEVEHWRPRGSIPCQQEGFLYKLENWIKTALRLTR